jgi:serine/threonine-protein kinase
VEDSTGSSGTETPAAAERKAARAIDLTQDRWLGRYELLFKLARGGMGTVYVARLVGAHGFDKLVAVKLLHDAMEGSAQLRAFLNEARVSARIDHANVVQTLELGEHDGVPFIVMELVRGVSLSAVLRELRAREQRMDPALAAWVVGRAARGLHAAHELLDAEGRAMKLVHRDVSPQNVLVSYEGRVAVADFGIAKLADTDPTSVGVVKGKFAYMSPEQARAETLDRRSDVFALGVVLHEALTGKRLFATDSPLTTIGNVLDMEVAPPHELASDVPEAISSVTMMCLSKERDDRFATARAMGDALSNAIAESGLRADEQSLGELVAELFPERKKRFDRKVDLAMRQSKPPDEAGNIDAAPLDIEATGEGEALARTVEDELPTAKPRRWPLVAAGVVALAGALWIGQGFRDGAPPSAASDSGEAMSTEAPPSAPPEPAAASATAAASASARETAVPTATASASASAAPIRRRPPPRTPRPRPKAKPKSDVPLFDDIGN